jgi:branched-chain amino acid transport system substrate-binding protein
MCKKRGSWAQREVRVPNVRDAVDTERRNPMKIKVVCGLLVCAVIIAFLCSGCGPKPLPKDKIRIGRAVSLTGPNALIATSASIPVYDMWVDEVNARGGIYVAEYGSRLPVELIVYDDESNQKTMVDLLTQLIEEDGVDFVFAPCGTAYLFAAAPVANDHEYILMGAEGGGLESRKHAAILRYFFPVLNCAETQMPAMARMYKQNGIRSVAIIYLDDDCSTEYTRVATEEFGMQGIAVKMSRSIPAGAQDVAPLLQEAHELDVDALVGFTYPDESVRIAQQAMELGIDFKALHLNLAAGFGWFEDMFGKAARGITGGGAWNRKSSPAAKEFCDHYVARYGEPAVDWWGQLFYWSSLQFFEQAIEKAGTLDQQQIRDIMDTSQFETALGLTWFEGGVLAPACHPGAIGQWQQGTFEVVAQRDKATAQMLFPKPAWPGQAQVKSPASLTVSSSW